MDSFAPLFLLLVIYCFVVLPISRLNKAAKKTMTNEKAALRKARDDRKDAAPGDGNPPADPGLPHEAPRAMQPTIRVTGHDDSVYQGSLNAVTGEGYDPCHDQQLAPLTRAGSVVQVQETKPGLQLSWTGSEIVRGFVMSEILKRRGA